MRSKIVRWGGLVALGLLLSAGAPKVVAGPAPLSTYLPSVYTNTTTVTTLVTTDTVMVSAYVLPGTQRILLTYINRGPGEGGGNRLHVVEDRGTFVSEVPLPSDSVVDPSQNQPSFTIPGDKQANGVVVATGSTLHVYVTTRDGETGPFNLRRIDMPIPAPPSP